MHSKSSCDTIFSSSAIHSYWIQTFGTAMGTLMAHICYPLLCNPRNTNHPTISSNNFLSKMKSKIYIDDCFIIWVPTSTNPIEDHKSYNSFISLMNKFGTLKWNAESRKLSTTFLDLTISINLHTRSIDTTLFENQ